MMIAFKVFRTVLYKIIDIYLTYGLVDFETSMLLEPFEMFDVFRTSIE